MWNKTIGNDAIGNDAWGRRRTSRAQPAIGAVAIAICLLIVAGVAGSARSFSQETTGLQAALALEQALVKTIADTERSLVSIARVSRPGNESLRDPRTAFQPFNQPMISPRQPDPTDPEFVPNEFATGVVIDASGLILTNFHVIDRDSDHFVTTVDRKVFHTKIKAADPSSDLAVLEVIERPTGKDFVPIKFGNAKSLRKGQIVIALGNPYAIARDGQASASWGIISNLARKVGPRSTDERLTLRQFGTLIQTDAKLNLGTSGGALVNLQGEMIGLTTSLAANSGYEQAAGYAIPIDDTFLGIIERLKKGREVEYGFLGINPVNLGPNDVLGGKHGIRVSAVQPGTPAKRAEIAINDVITHVNGEPIYDISGLRLNVAKLPVSTVATLTVERGGETLVKHVVLTKFHVSRRKIATEREPAWRGMRVDFPSAVLESSELDSAVESAVAVSEVAENSPAYRADVRPQMLITHVGNTPVETPEDLRRELAARRGKVELKVLTGHGDYRTVEVGEK